MNALGGAVSRHPEPAGSAGCSRSKPGQHRAHMFLPSKVDPWSRHVPKVPPYRKHKPWPTPSQHATPSSGAQHVYGPTIVRVGESTAALTSIVTAASFLWVRSSSRHWRRPNAITGKTDRNHGIPAWRLVAVTDGRIVNIAGSTKEENGPITRYRGSAVTPTCGIGSAVGKRRCGCHRRRCVRPVHNVALIGRLVQSFTGEISTSHITYCIDRCVLVRDFAAKGYPVGVWPQTKGVEIRGWVPSPKLAVEIEGPVAIGLALPKNSNDVLRTVVHACR